jgi:serine/threonine-protein kinase
MKTCPSCHQVLPDDALFCPIDGTSVAAAESDPLLGSVVADRYVLLERIGHGNSGVIYRGEHVVLRQPIAIKLLHPQLSADATAVDRFRQEATTLARLKSDHIVRVSDFGVAQDGRVFFAMEYLEGETLATALGREGHFKEGRAVSVLQQIGSVLEEAHSLGYSHRDIRPRNIFLLKNEGAEQHVKLLDFGLAKLVDPPKGAATTFGTPALGDPRYMSPEQARGDTADARSDIYTLGIIAYEMVTGTPPFVGGGTFDVLTKHLEAQPVPLADKVPSVSKHFAGTVARALSKKARDRYPTVKRFLQALTGQVPVEDTPEEKAAAIRAETAAIRADVAGAAVRLAAAIPPSKISSPAVAASAVATKRESSLPAASVATSSRSAAARPLSAAAPAPSAAAPAPSAAAPAPLAAAPAPLVAAPAPLAAASPAAAVPAGAQDHPPTPGATKRTEVSPAATLIGTGVQVKDMAALSKTEKPSPLHPAGAPATAGQPSGKASDAASTLKGPAPSQVAVSGTVEVPSTRASVEAVAAPKAAVAAATAKTDHAADVPAREDRPPKRRTGSFPQYSLPEGPDLEAYQGKSASQTGNWFAEGLAAEEALQSTTPSGHLPAIYDAMDESQSIPRGLPPAAIIGAVVAVAAVALVLALFIFKPAKKTHGPVVTPVAADAAPAAPPEPKPASAPPKLAAASPAKTDAELGHSAGTAPEPGATEKPTLGVVPEPEPKAAPKPGPKPAPEKAVAKKEPKAAPKPEPKPAPKKALAKAELKHEPKPAEKTKHAAKVKPQLEPKREPAKAAAKTGHDPGEGEAQVKAGRNSLTKGDYTRAKEAFSKALELNPQSGAAHAGLGEVAFEMGQYPLAVQHLRTATRGSPRNSRYLVMLGNAYFKQGKTKQSVEEYRKALAADPNNAEARAGLQAAVRRLAGGG